MEMVGKHSGAAAGLLGGRSEKPSYGSPVREDQPRADLPVCSACGKGLTSSLSTAGKCLVCHDAICFRCWASGTRQCSTHAAAPDDSRTSSSETFGPALHDRPALSWGRSGERTKCGRCGKEVRQAVRGQGRTVYCEACQEALCQVPAVLPSNAVLIDQANYLETAFHRFVCEALRRASGAGLWDSTWGGRLNRLGQWSTETLPARFLETHVYASALRPRIPCLPENQGVLLHVRMGGRPWSRLPFGRGLRVAAVSHTPLLPLLERGYADQPAGARELGVMMSSPLQEKDVEVWTLFSPTGWREGLPIPGNVVLVSHVPGGRWSARHELRDVKARLLIDRAFDDEHKDAKVQRCVNAALGLPGSHYPVSAARLASEQHLPLHIVLEAFRRIESSTPGFLLCEDSRKNDWLLDVK